MAKQRHSRTLYFQGLDEEDDDAPRRRRIPILVDDEGSDDDDDDDSDDDDQNADVNNLDSNTEKTKRSLVWSLTIVALVVATHLTLAGTENNGESSMQTYDDQDMLEPSTAAKWHHHTSRRINFHGHGTVRFARHFAPQRRRSPVSNESDDDGGGGSGDGADDRENTELFAYFGFREKLVSPGHFETFSATPAGPTIALSSLAVGTGSSQRKADYHTTSENTDRLVEDAIVASVRSGWNVIDTSIQHRQQRGERCVGRALRRLCGGGIARDYHHAYGRSDDKMVRQPLSSACRTSLFLASKAGFIPGDADSDDPPRAKKAWIDTLLRHHHDDSHAHASSSSPFLRFERTDIVENSHCISPACLKVSLQRSIANIFGSLGPAASLDIYYLDSAAEMQLPMIHKRLVHSGNNISYARNHGEHSHRSWQRGSSHDDAEMGQVGLTLFLERLRRAFIFLERARLVGYADPMFPGGFNISMPSPSVTASADSSPPDNAAAASYSGHPPGDVSLIHFYGMATSKCFRVPPSHELYVPLRSVVKIAESAHAFVLNSSAKAQRRAHFEPALLHHGFRFIQVPVNLGMPEVATELWQPSEDGMSNLHTLLEVAALLGVRVTASQSVGLGGHRKLDDGVGCQAFRAVEINFAEPLVLQEKLGRAKQEEEEEEEEEEERWAGHVKTELITDATLQLHAWRASIGSKRGSKGSRRLQLTRSTPGLTTAIAVHKTPKYVEANTALASIPRFSSADYEDIREECS